MQPSARDKISPLTALLIAAMSVPGPITGSGHGTFTVAACATIGADVRPIIAKLATQTAIPAPERRPSEVRVTWLGEGDTALILFMVSVLSVRIYGSLPNSPDNRTLHGFVRPP